jgi:hypothetical protein
MPHGKDAGFLRVLRVTVGVVSPILHGGARAQNSIQQPCCARAGEGCSGNRRQASQHRELGATLAENQRERGADRKYAALSGTMRTIPSCLYGGLNGARFSR